MYFFVERIKQQRRITRLVEHLPGVWPECNRYRAATILTSQPDYAAQQHFVPAMHAVKTAGGDNRTFKFQVFYIPVYGQSDNYI